MRVLLIDDHALFRMGLSELLQRRGIEVAAALGDCTQGIQAVIEHQPDVVLLDIGLPGLSGFEVTMRLKQASPGLGIIILTIHEQAPYPAQLLEAGASGYLTKGCPATELVEAIKTVARGGRHIGSLVAQQMALEMMPGHQKSPFDGLSAREMEVMRMLADGRKIADIANIMHLSPKTIATYKYRIFDKLNTRSDVDMTRMALRYGVV